MRNHSRRSSGLVALTAGCVFAALVGSPTAGHSAPTSKSKPLPNIVLCMADDMQ